MDDIKIYNRKNENYMDSLIAKKRYTSLMKEFIIKMVLNVNLNRTHTSIYADSHYETMKTIKHRSDEKKIYRIPYKLLMKTH